MLAILRPVTNALDRTQADDCNIAEACHLLLNLRNSFLQSEHITREMKKSITSRFKAAMTPAHFLAYILDPRYLGSSLDHAMEEAAEDLLRKQNSDLLPVLYEFQAKGPNIPQHMFEESFITQLPRKVWWRTMQRKVKVLEPLATLAIKLNSLPASSAAIERVFSGFSLIQTKLRNRLAIAKMAKLAVCYRNLRDIELENEQIQIEYELENE